MREAVDLANVLSTFAEPWAPRTVALVNDYDIRCRAGGLGELRRPADVASEHPD